MDLRIVRGAEVAPYLADLARLRIEVFREWPYLYAGNTLYEEAYLRVYVESPDSVFVLAMDEGRIVGASSGLPLEDESEAFRAPFDDAGIDAARVFYFGESVVYPAYRGRGLGHAFFDSREAHAAGLARFDWTAFCAVDRAENDPRRPSRHRDNEALWAKRGYERRDDLRCRLGWPEQQSGADVEHTLTFRLRRLDAEAGERFR